MTIKEAVAHLNLPANITKADIKKAYRLSAQVDHPDKKGTAEAFRRTKQAYDLLMKTPLDDIRQTIKQATKQKSTKTSYDPFADPDYDRRNFFQPDNPKIEGLERSIRAGNCPHCHGLGYITKNTDPNRGFLGLETRLCKCQWL